MSAHNRASAASLGAAGLVLDVQPPRATITLNRPDVLNAQTPDMWRALRDAGESLTSDVAVVVLRGAGRAFSAGLDRRLLPLGDAADASDLGRLATLSSDEAETVLAGYQSGFTWLRDPARLTIAAVHGHAIGAGFQLALACDLRIVADDVQFCMAEPRFGIVPDLGGTYPLVHAVGYAAAVEICLTSRRVGAEEAVRIGLALRSVPAAELAEATESLVEAVLAVPAGAMRETLGLLAGVADGIDPAAALHAERAAQLRRFRALFAAHGTR